INQLTQFRLAVDAVHSKHQPLWKEMKYAVMSAFDKMKQAMEQEDEQSFQQAFHQFLQRYELIEPSVKINVDREQVQR
ncbi:sporulation protein YpjB, partial [Enterococcus faecium]